VIDPLELLDKVFTADIVLVPRADLDTLTDEVPVFECLVVRVTLELDVWDSEPIALALIIGE
jgi:hypothetical protein